MVKRAQQNLFPLRRLKIFGMGPQILKRVYSCTIERILTGCITAWYGKCSDLERKSLQRVVWTAQYITEAKLPAIQDLDTRRCQRKALKIVKVHGKWYRCTNSVTNRTLNSFYPQAIRLPHSLDSYLVNYLTICKTFLHKIFFSSSHTLLLQFIIYHVA